MKNFILFLFSIIIAFFQLSVVGSFIPESQLPDLLLGFVVTLVLSIGFESSIGWILFASFLLDSGTSSLFGVSALAYIFVAWLTSLFLMVVSFRSRKIVFIFSLGALVALLETIKIILYIISLWVKAYYLNYPFSFSFSEFFGADFLFKIFYTIAGAYIIYYIFRRISRTFFIQPIQLSPKSRFSSHV